jgi:thiol peroxidase
MKAVKRAKKEVKKAGKAVKKAVQKAIKKAGGTQKALGKKKAGVKAAIGKVAGKVSAEKDALINKLNEELSRRERIIQASSKTLKEALEKAEKEVTELKNKTNQSILELRTKAGEEAKKFKEELEVKSQALRGKITELEEYKKAAESKIFELQAKVKEFVAKVGGAEKERPGLVTFKGNSLTLLGQEVRIGDKAPGFQVVDNAMQPVSLESFKGKVKIISAVPSLDTPVCDMETRRFNEEAGKLPEKVAILTISMDLPFAQARWCAAAGVEKVKTFSDYRDRSFGLAYGVLIKELKLLARTVFIVDEQDVIRHVQRVAEITQEPDYDRVLNAVRALL